VVLLRQPKPPVQYQFLKQARPGEILTGAINHSRGVLHGSYKKSLLCGVSHRNILHGENEVFQRNRNDFPKVSFTLDVIGGHMGHYFAIGSE
jgi:hypothetical protein